MKNCTCHIASQASGHHQTSSANCRAHRLEIAATAYPCCADGVCPQHVLQAIEDRRESEARAYPNVGKLISPRVKDLL